MEYNGLRKYYQLWFHLLCNSVGKGYSGIIAVRNYCPHSTAWSPTIYFDGRTHCKILTWRCFRWQSTCNWAAIRRSVPGGDHYKYHPCEGEELLPSADCIVGCEPLGRNHLACPRWLLCEQHLPMIAIIRSLGSYHCSFRGLCGCFRTEAPFQFTLSGTGMMGQFP
jgi:hypothetical protein